MSLNQKRSLDSSRRSVSPPIKRIKCSAADHSTVTLSKKQSHFTIYSWNVNGIGGLLQKELSFHGNHSTYPLRDFLKRHEWPQILCLQEVKVSAKDAATQQKLEIAANVGNLGHEPTYTTYLSLPRDKYNAISFGGKVHGVATLIRDDVVQNVVEIRRPDWDLEGRVLISEMRDSLAIINGYWVNGTSNRYRDPSSGEVTGTRHDHKLWFHSKMLEESKTLTNRGFQVCHIGDMNVARGRIDGHPNLRTSPDQHVRNRADFNKKFFYDPRGFRGIDVFRQLHGDQRKYTYHPRGRPWGTSCDRVDLIIISPALIDAVVATDICDNLQDRAHSDHVPLWVTIDVDNLRVIPDRLLGESKQDSNHDTREDVVECKKPI